MANTINLFTNFFQLAAWTAMRHQFNGRMALRMMFYMGMGAFSDTLPMAAYEEFLYLLDSHPMGFWEFDDWEGVDMEQLLPLLLEMR